MASGAISPNELLSNYLKEVDATSQPVDVAIHLDDLCRNANTSLGDMRRAILDDLNLKYLSITRNITPVCWGLTTLATVSASMFAYLQGHPYIGKIIAEFSIVPMVFTLGTWSYAREQCRGFSVLRSTLESRDQILDDVASHYLLIKKHAKTSE